MTILYKCRNCGEELEVTIEDVFINTEHRRLEKDQDFDIQDFECIKCGYENFIKIFCEVE